MEVNQKYSFNNSCLKYEMLKGLRNSNVLLVIKQLSHFRSTQGDVNCCYNFENYFNVPQQFT